MNLALGRDFAVISCSLCRGPTEVPHLCQALPFLDQLPPRLEDAGSPRDLSRLNFTPEMNTWLPSAVVFSPSMEHRSSVISPLNGSPDCNREKAPHLTQSQQVSECCCALCSRASMKNVEGVVELRIEPIARAGNRCCLSLPLPVICEGRG